jgi:hypothetical protein
MATREDENAARDRISHDVESDELVRFDVERYAQLEWDERQKPDRPEATGQWMLHFPDGSSEEIDLPKDNVDGAVDEAKRQIANRMTGR